MPKTTINNLALNDGRNISFTLKRHTFNLFERPGNNLWSFDLEGRLIGMYVKGVNYRRTLDNRFFKKSRLTIKGEVFRETTDITYEKSRTLLLSGINILRQCKDQIPGIYREVIQKVITMTLKRLEESGRTFSQIYLPISILPPDQYRSLVIQLTEGCNYNRCTFCNFYRNRPFRIKSLNELRSHVNQILSFFGQGLRLRKSIFLADANALVIPQNRLVPALQFIRQAIPTIPKIYSFIDVFTGVRKSAGDFKQLAELGIRRVYIGIESGNPELLELLNKPQLTNDILELSHNLKAGGIQIGLIFLIGIGGNRYADRHLEDSMKLIEQIPLSSGDIIYFSEFHETNPEYRQILNQHNIPLPGRMEIRQLSKQFKTAMKAIVPKGVKVSIYDINQFWY